MTIRGIEAELIDWFVTRIPAGWTTEPPEVRVDKDEIQVIITIADTATSDSATAKAPEEAERLRRIKEFRELTRPERVVVAQEAERRFGKSISWGVQCGPVRALFTHLSLPVMTRLRLSERTVLDTLVDSGVARSRSDALGWCVRLVSRNQGPWIDDLKAALVKVDEVRSEGPEA
jgi:hypothetical protein